MRAAGALLSRQDWPILLAVALALAAGVLAFPVEETGQQTHTGGGDLSVTWVDGTDHIEIVAVGFRGRSTVGIKVGSGPGTKVGVDEAGTVRATVAVDGAEGGRPGASVLVSGRAAKGPARALLGAVPPRPTAHGPVDLLPWTLLAVATAVTLVWYLRRRRHGSPHEIRSDQ